MCLVAFPGNKGWVVFFCILSLVDVSVCGRNMAGEWPGCMCVCTEVSLLTSLASEEKTKTQRLMPEEINLHAKHSLFNAHWLTQKPWLKMLRELYYREV